MLKSAIQPRNKIRRDRELKCISSPAPGRPNRRQLAAAIQHELGIGQTYLTVARLAYDMGQTGRGDRARERGIEACLDAARAMGRLPVPAPALLTKALEALTDSLNTVSPDTPAFAAPVRQPSMS